MKTISVYIDYSDADDKALACKLRDRLKGNIKHDVNITIYEDVAPGDDVDEHYWEENTINAIKESEIIIPILSSSYFSFVTPGIEHSLNNAIDSSNKFLFPILHRPSEWGSFTWVVRSKLMPLDGQPLSEHSDNEQDVLVNDLIKTIKNIIAKYYSQSLLSSDAGQEIISGNDNVLFISHDHDDADFAELLKLTLEKNGLDAWIDSERLKIGQDWREEIDQGIESSLAVIAVMTPDARKSEYVTYEWAFAWGKGKKIFPIMLKQTQLHPRLESLQYLDFTNRSTRPWEELISTIKELINNQ